MVFRTALEKSFTSGKNYLFWRTKSEHTTERLKFIKFYRQTCNSSKIMKQKPTKEWPPDYPMNNKVKMELWLAIAKISVDLLLITLDLFLITPEVNQ